MFYIIVIISAIFIMPAQVLDGARSSADVLPNGGWKIPVIINGMPLYLSPELLVHFNPDVDPWK